MYQKDTSFKAKVISGEVFGVKGPIEAVTPTYYIDFTLDNGKAYEHKIPAGWNSMIVVYKGCIKVQDDSTKKVNAGSCAVFKMSPDQD